MDEQTPTNAGVEAEGPVAPATRSVGLSSSDSAPIPLAKGYSDDQIAHIHAAALTVLQELGVRMNP